MTHTGTVVDTKSDDGTRVLRIRTRLICAVPNSVTKADVGTQAVGQVVGLRVGAAQTWRLADQAGDACSLHNKVSRGWGLGGKAGGQQTAQTRRGILTPQAGKSSGSCWARAEAAKAPRTAVVFMAEGRWFCWIGLVRIDANKRCSKSV